MVGNRLSSLTVFPFGKKAFFNLFLAAFSIVYPVLYSYNGTSKAEKPQQSLNVFMYVLTCDQNFLLFHLLGYAKEI